MNFLEFEQKYFSEDESYLLNDETQATMSIKQEDQIFSDYKIEHNEEICEFIDLKEKVSNFKSEVSRLKLENIIACEELKDRSTKTEQSYQEAMSKKNQLSAQLDYIRRLKEGKIPSKIEKRLSRLNDKLDQEIKANQISKFSGMEFANELKMVKNTLLEVQSAFNEGIEAKKLIKCEKRKIRFYMKHKVKGMIARHIDNQNSRLETESIAISETKIRLKRKPITKEIFTV